MLRPTLILEAGVVAVNPWRASAGRPARVTTAPKVARVEVHVAPPARSHGIRRVVPELLRDGVGHDAEALAELVHEAEGELVVPHCGPHKE